MKTKVSRETSCQVSQKQLQFCRMKLWKICLKCGKLYFLIKCFLPSYFNNFKKRCAVF